MGNESQNNRKSSLVSIKNYGEMVATCCRYLCRRERRINSKIFTFSIQLSSHLKCLTFPIFHFHFERKYFKINSLSNDFLGQEYFYHFKLKRRNPKGKRLGKLLENRIEIIKFIHENHVLFVSYCENENLHSLSTASRSKQACS